MYHVFIINPISGNKNGLKAAKIIEDYCVENKLLFKIIYTNSNNNAQEIASYYKNNKNVIIYSVGGDGTLNEVINGMHDGIANLSIIPTGTGNDFYKCVKKFNGNKIDLGKVNDKYFINIASIGFDAEVANLANTYKEKNLPNKLVYILSLIKNYFSYKNIEVRSNERKKCITIFTVCNGSYYGGGFKINPNAKLDSGLFDIVEADSLNKLQILNLLTKLAKSNHLTDKKINYYNTDNISIESNIPLICNVDGEIIKDNKFNFIIKKQAIEYKQLDNNLKNKLLLKKIIK